MTKQNLTLFFSILSAGLLGLWIVGVVFILKQIWFNPVEHKIPEEYRIAENRQDALECPVATSTVPTKSSTPKSLERPKESQTRPPEENNEDLIYMFQQLQEAQKQMKKLEEQIKKATTSA